MMAPKSLSPLVLVLALGLLHGFSAQAQQHRATRLGHPATRFDTPLARPEQLRTLLTSERLKADVLAILRQADWPGDVEDLRRAAANAPISETEIAPGTRMPFMSSRKNGQPVTLKDVLWAGERPVEAYVFEFASKGRRYRCTTPKPCSNFFVEDLGPVVPPPLKPALSLTKTAPSEAVLCEPFEVSLAVRNTGNQALNGVRVSDLLPAGLATVDGRNRLDLEAGALPPGQGREFQFQVVAAAAGAYENRAEAVAAEGVRAEAASRTVVKAPELTLACQTPEEGRVDRPVEVCLVLRNTGDAAEPQAVLELPVPDGATFVSATGGGGLDNGRVAWPPAALAPGAAREVCAVFRPPGVVTLEFAPAARGVCAAPAATRCTSRVAGIPAILVEAIDLEDPVEVGKEVTYEVRITNQGSAPGTGVRLVCTLPEGQEFIGGGGATPVTAEGRTIRTQALPVLDAKARATWRVTVRALTAGDTRFKLELTSDQFLKPIEEFEATTQY